MQDSLTMNPVESVTDNIVEQLERLESDADMTSASDFCVAQRWESWNTRLGVMVVLFSAAVTTLAAVGAAGISVPPYLDTGKVILAITLLGSLTTVFGAILTFLKPAERAGRYREFGNKQTSLRNRIRLYRTVSIFYAADQNLVHEQLVAFLGEKDALNSDNPPIANWAFAQASKDIEDKDKRRGRRLGQWQSAPPPPGRLQAPHPA